MKAGIPWIGLGLSVAVTIFATFLTYNVTTEIAKERFEAEVTQTTSAIEIRLKSYEQILLGGKGLFVASKQVTRDEWKQFVETQAAATRFPGIQGVGHSKLIGGKDKLAAHIEEIRKEGFPEYTVRPEGDRDEYHSIIYLEPFDERNQRAFGYDMYSEPVRRAAMDLARDSGVSTISGKVKLVQETEVDVQPGFLMYVPLYDGAEIPQTVEERRSLFRGFVYAPFRMNNFMDGILGAAHQDITFVLCDTNTDPQNLLYDYSTTKGINDEIDQSLSKTIVLDTHQRQWVLKFVALKSIHSELETIVPSLVLFSGIAFSILLFFIFRTYSNVIRLTQESLKNQKMVTIGELASRLAHDLRNPLSVIKNSIELIEFHQKGTLSENSQEYIKMIRGAIFRMRHQLEDVLDYVRIKPLDIATASIKEIIAASIKTTPIPQKIKVIVPENDVQIHCDKKQLVVALSNIIINAVQAIGQNDGAIAIRVSQKDNNALIEIEDTGPGILDDDLPKIFEPLFTTKQEGTGLGLVSCKNIVERHGGTVSAKNNPTTFTVNLPIKQ
jgi:hypothetical protein